MGSPTRSACGRARRSPSERPAAQEVRFRVAGVVRALEVSRPDRLGPRQPLLAAARGSTPSLAIRLDPGADRARSRARLHALGVLPQSRAGGATTRNGQFLGILAAVLRGVGLAIGLVCLYALVQALAMTARERRGAVALAARDRRGPRRGRARARGRGARRRRCPAALAASCSSASSLGPLVARLAAGFADARASRRRSRRSLLVAARPARAGRRRDRRWSRAACCASPSSRGCGRSDAAPDRAPGRRGIACSACSPRWSPPAAGPALARRRAAAGLDAGLDARRPRRRRLPRARRRASRCATAPSSRPGAPARTLATFGQLTDAHVRDEESPARVPFLDRLGGAVHLHLPPPGGADPTQVLDAAVRSLDRLRPQAVFRHRRPRDSAQDNELDAARSARSGGRVHPDSRRARLRRRAAGEQPRPVLLPARRSTRRATPACSTPRRAAVHTRPGCARRGTRCSATTTCSPRARSPPTPAIERVATGDRLVDIARPAACGRRATTDAAAAVAALLAGGAARSHRAPRARRSRAGAILAPAPRCCRRARAAGGTPDAPGRLDYTFDVGPLGARRSCSTSSTARAARAGSSPPAEVAWLRAELRARRPR